MHNNKKICLYWIPASAGMVQGSNITIPLKNGIQGRCVLPLRSFFVDDNGLPTLPSTPLLDTGFRRYGRKVSWFISALTMEIFPSFAERLKSINNGKGD